ncbi:MAG: NAD(P)/FAD-dependent oxidoreductase [Verrucomicrobia bacterium]|nr:NAD(P)/FAD-dependent oxidoreductase [Verrucomicrobiota bacterium]
MNTELDSVPRRTEEGAAWPRVLIIGGGFAGLEAAKALADAPVRVTLIDRRNHHLFQPLLYQVATAALAPAQIAAPLRQVLAGQRNAEVFLADAKHINLAHRRVVTDDLVFDYDYLIVATGARHSYFGHDEWEQHAPGLKQMSDALEIRQRFLAAFEVAEKATDEAVRDAAMTFVVVGGGPTGVEMAGAIMEIARFSMTENFRRIDPSKARVILLEGGPRLLPSFPEDLSESARRQLEKIGVEVQLGRRVTGVDADGVIVDGQRLAARTVIWAAGNVASPLLKSMIGIELDRAGRAVVKDDLTLPQHPEVFVLGDAANFSHQGGQPLPGTSPVAMQQGRHAAAVICDRLAGREPRPFHFVDKGSMATIGRAKAVAQLFPTVFRRFHLSGLLAWFGWLFIHLLYLVGFRNKVGVLAEWGWAYLTHYRGSRLITRDLEPGSARPRAIEALKFRS